MRYLRHLWFFALLALCLVIISQVKVPFNPMKAQVNKGLVELDSGEIASGEVYQLIGDWSFYHDSFLINDNEDIAADGYLGTGKGWNDFELENQAIGGRGYGTYRLEISMDPAEVNVMSIRIEEVLTSYRLFWNGELIREVGRPGRDSESTIHAYETVKVDIDDIRETNYLVIEVANYGQQVGGIWGDIYIGNMVTLEEVIIFNTSLEMFFFGALIMMAWYHILLYILRQSDRMAFMYALFMFALAFRILLMGERIVNFLFTIPWNWAVRIEIFLFYLAVILFFGFIYEVFTDVFDDRIFKVILVIGGVFLATVMFFSPYVFTHTLLYFGIYGTIAALYVIYVVLRAVKLKKEGAKVIATGILILITAAVNDLLYTQELVNTGYLLSYGLIIYAFCQALIVARRNVKVFRDSEYYAKKSIMLGKMAETDLMTGLLNHTSIIDRTEQQKMYHEAEQKTMAVGMMDVDHFKEINDTYGHQLGDEVLVKIAEVLSASVRDEDLIGRYGGEEFLLCLPGADLKGASRILHRIRERIEVLDFSVPNLQVTISGGVVINDVTDETVSNMIRRADKKLYEAKDEGRNRVKD